MDTFEAFSTWEDFSNVLYLYRWCLKTTCIDLRNYWHENVNQERDWPWLEKRIVRFQKLDERGEKVEKKAKDAWEVLETAENRQRVLELLSSAFRDAYWQIYKGGPFIGQMMKADEARHKVILNADFRGPKVRDNLTDLNRVKDIQKPTDGAPQRRLVQLHSDGAG